MYLLIYVFNIFTHQNILSMASYEPWYTQRNPLDVVLGEETNDQPYQIYPDYGQLQPPSLAQRKEYLVGSTPPYYGSDEPWYAESDPINQELGAFVERTYLPPFRDHALAQSQYWGSGMREPMTPTRAQGPKCSKCTGTRQAHDAHKHIEAFELSYGAPMPDGGNTDPNAANVSKVTSYTDPRFLAASADLNYNIGSDVQDITRVYGTVAQKMYYPKLSDYVKYGVASSIKPA